MPLCKIWIYKYYKNVTNMIDIVISDCYTVKSLKNIFCKMKKKQKDMQMFRRHYEIQIYQSICLGAAGLLVISTAAINNHKQSEDVNS